MIIGRSVEKAKLDQCVSESRSHFMVVYGRRRVGKTFLIKEHFNNNFTFYCTGLLKGKKAQQLNNFGVAMNEQLPHYNPNVKLNNWFEAFSELINALSKIKGKQKKIIFIDELPWMDTQGSDLLLGVEYFWNSWASARKDILLIVCGSATSWMVSNILNNTGGLYNRVTTKLKINPFLLDECLSFFKAKGFLYNEEQCLQAYMTFGGIPYYFDQFSKNLSPIQNIDELCFGSGALFAHEYESLFKSLFKNYPSYIAVMEAICTKNKGLSREEIVKLTGFSDGGNLTKILVNLEYCNFVRKYNSYGLKTKQSLFQVIDPYCLFVINMRRFLSQEHFWLNNFGSPKYYNWSGYAFEIVCFNHLHQIKAALGITGIQTHTGVWSNSHAQIDLLMDRADSIVNIIEIKFAKGPYLITKKYDAELRNKLQQFRQVMTLQKSLWPIIISPYGLARSAYNHFFIKQITLSSLFTPST
jgi:uncharacterized protein